MNIIFSYKLNITKSPNFAKRYMHRSRIIFKNITNFDHNTLNITRSFATKKAFKLYNKAATDLGNDGTGKHVHVFKNYCVLKDCENKECSTLCNQSLKSKILGHNTHKPPIGRVTRYIDDQDANGDSKTQYFVKTNKLIEITEKEKQQYGKDIKEDLKQTKFVEKHNNYDDQ